MKDTKLLNLKKEEGRDRQTKGFLAIVVIFSIVLLLNTFSLVSSQPSTTVYTFPKGYTIVPTEFEELKLGEDIIFNFYIYNSSDGIRIDNATTNCSFNLADSQGNLIFSGEPTYNSEGYWNSFINSSYLNETGYYYYGVDCQGELGAAYSEVLSLTFTGNNQATMFYLILLTGLALFFMSCSLFVDEEFFVYISGVLFLIGGIYLMINGLDIINDVNTRYLAFIYIGTGILFTIGAYIYNGYSKFKDEEEY